MIVRWLVCLLLLAGCHKKTDAERAAEERAKAHERASNALILVPYRSVKTIARSSVAKPLPPDLAKLVLIWSELKPEAVPSNALQEAAQLGKLAVALFSARSVLRNFDEDSFPLLWEVFFKRPAPLPWYTSPFEHLALAMAAWSFEVALNREPIADILFYELDRAPADPNWPRSIQAASQGARGLSYLGAGYHYAAEEELTSYLTNVNGDAQLEAAGYLARAWNRFALRRDDPAYDDLEAALTRFDQMGVDDELVDWGWATVKIHHKQYPEAAKRLEKLAQSPYLSDGERAQVKEYATSLEKNQGALLFGRERAQIILIRAVIARQGGLEKLLARLVGEETAHKIYQPLAFLHRVESSISFKK